MGLLLGAPHLGCSHHLHGLGDLGSVLDRFDSSANVACAGHESSSLAFVCLALSSGVGAGKFLNGCLEIRRQGIREGFLLDNPGHQVCFASGKEVSEFVLEVLDLFHRNLVEMAVLNRPEDGNLTFYRKRVMYWGCLNTSTMRLPRSSWAWVLASRSEPN